MKDHPEIGALSDELDVLAKRVNERRHFLLKQAVKVGEEAGEFRKMAWDRIFALLKEKFPELPDDWKQENYAVSLADGVVRWWPARGNNPLDGLPEHIEQLKDTVSAALAAALAGKGRSVLDAIKAAEDAAARGEGNMEVRVHTFDLGDRP